MQRTKTFQKDKGGVSDTEQKRGHESQMGCIMPLQIFATVSMEQSCCVANGITRSEFELSSFAEAELAKIDAQGKIKGGFLGLSPKASFSALIKILPATATSNAKYMMLTEEGIFGIHTKYTACWKTEGGGLGKKVTLKIEEKLNGNTMNETSYPCLPHSCDCLNPCMTYSTFVCFQCSKMGQKKDRVVTFDFTAIDACGNVDRCVISVREPPIQ